MRPIARLTGPWFLLVGIVVTTVVSLVAAQGQRCTGCPDVVPGTPCANNGWTSCSLTCCCCKPADSVASGCKCWVTEQCDNDDNNCINES